MCNNKKGDTRGLSGKFYRGQKQYFFAQEMSDLVKPFPMCLKYFSLNDELSLGSSLFPQFAFCSSSYAPSQCVINCTFTGDLQKGCTHIPFWDSEQALGLIRLKPSGLIDRKYVSYLLIMGKFGCPESTLEI